MKTKYLFVVLTIIAATLAAEAQGTAFTYQGRLENNGQPATGNYDFLFRLSLDAEGSNYVAEALTNDVPVSNGLFTAGVDFGSGVLNGSAFWVAVYVRTNNGGLYAALFPLQALRPTPYAVFATSASKLSGTLSFANLGTNNYLENGAPGGTISGGANNQIWTGAGDSTIAGGYYNQIEYSSSSSFVGGGEFNEIWMDSGGSVIAGGVQNTIQTNSGDSVISGGSYNTIEASAGSSVIAGGDQNDIRGYGDGIIVGGIIGGGVNNQILADSEGATIAGGFYNTSGGRYATVPGGRGNSAEGTASFAAGLGARAWNNGSFVWADDSADNGAGAPTDYFMATRDNQFRVRAAGGVDLEVSGSFGLNPAALYVNSTSSSGVALCASQNSSDSATVFVNSGSGDIIKGFSGGTGGNLVFEVNNNGTVFSQGVALTSDRNAKENFAPISPAAILDKLASLPISEWSYKTDQSARHIGPTAQDFHAAFGLSGGDDRHISMIDEQGVALAAIQGLKQKLEEKDAEIDSLRARLEKLERLISPSPNH